MQLNLDVAVVSFILGIVSLAVGVLAMVLSLLFYFKSNELVLETTRTLGEIRQTTKSLEASVGTIISRTIDYLTAGARAPQAESKKTLATTEELFERVKAKLGDTELGQKVDDLEKEFKDLQKAYADGQSATAIRGELGAHEFVTAAPSVRVASKEDYVDLLRNQGWQRYLVGDLAGSIEASRHVLELEPDDPYARPNLALALLMKGEKREALDEYDRFVKQSPQSRFLWLAVQDLEQLRGSGADGLEQALQMMVAAAQEAESGEQLLASEDEVPF